MSLPREDLDREILRDLPDIYVETGRSNAVGELATPDDDMLLNLRNFPADSHALLPAHVEALKRFAIPRLRLKDCRLEIYALAGRGSNAATNRHVATQRLRAVQAFLDREGVPASEVYNLRHKALGEDPAGSEALARSVLVFVWEAEVDMRIGTLYRSHREILDFARASGG